MRNVDTVFTFSSYSVGWVLVGFASRFRRPPWHMSMKRTRLYFSITGCYKIAVLPVFLIARWIFRSGHQRAGAATMSHGGRWRLVFPGVTEHFFGTMNLKPSLQRAWNLLTEALDIPGVSTSR